MQPDAAGALVDLPSVGAVLKIPQATLRSWARRYPNAMPKRGRDHAGRTLYRYGDVCQVATERALAIANTRTPSTKVSSTT